MSVTRSGSGVGSQSRVVMRGDRSINGNSRSPYIVDVVPAAGISNINPDDIASINVLKGPNAGALYGSRANNGAIIVATKRGSADGFSASLEYLIYNGPADFADQIIKATFKMSRRKSN